MIPFMARRGWTIPPCLGGGLVACALLCNAPGAEAQEGSGKQREGQYVLVQAQFAPKFCSELERNLRFLEPVMRFMIKLMD